jgi:hypothetical protein
MLVWILLFLALATLVAVACSSFRAGRARSEQASSAAFVPDPNNDKVIIVKGWNDNQLSEVIGDFIDTYNNDGYPAYTIEPHKQAGNTFRLAFPQDIHPLLFTFLVNYAAYPFDLDLTDRLILVGGKTTLTSLFEGVDPSLVGEKAILYLPENDQDHTVVYLHTADGSTFANSFSELGWRRVNEARLSIEVKQLLDGA